jgi:ankyrin repeat protein
MFLERDNVDIDEMDGVEGATTPHYAVDSGHETIARLILDHGANVNITNNDGFTGLYVAVYYGAEAIVRLLLESGANISVVCKKGARVMRGTALSVAASQGHKGLVELLMEKRADINVGNRMVAFNGTVCGCLQRPRRSCQAIIGKWGRY